MNVNQPNNVDSCNENQEFKLSDFYLNDMKIIRNVFAAFFPVAIVAIYLAINTNLISLTLIMGFMSFGLLVIAGAIERYRKSCQTKKIIHSSDGVTVSTDSTNKYLAWNSISSAYQVNLPRSVILKDNENKQVLIEERLNDSTNQFNQMLFHLKTKIEVNPVNIIFRKVTRIIECWLLGFLLFFCALLSVAPQGPHYNEILVLSSIIIIIHALYWAWPKFKQIELKENKLKVSTQYGVKFTHEMDQIAQVTFLSSLVMDNLKKDCSILFRNEEIFTFSMNGWDYVQLLNLFRNYDIQIKVGS
jgi:hypothetical protein